MVGKPRIGNELSRVARGSFVDASGHGVHEKSGSDCRSGHGLKERAEAGWLSKLQLGLQMFAAVFSTAAIVQVTSYSKADRNGDAHVVCSSTYSTGIVGRGWWMMALHLDPFLPRCSRAVPV